MTDTDHPTTSREFAADVRTTSNSRMGYATFRRAWKMQTGESLACTSEDSREFRISAQAVKVDATVIADVHSESLIDASSSAESREGQVLGMHVIEHGAWRFFRRTEGELAIPSGHFLIRRTGPPTRETAQRTKARVLMMHDSTIGPLLADRFITGPATTPEMRLLLGHVRLMVETVNDLGPSGSQAAHSALDELVKGVVRRQADTTESAFAPALVRAAQDLADRHLSSPDLSPSMLASRLGVSVRTLHRAFAETQETVAAYIRRRRLQRARADLLTGQSNISDIAAHWQFADSSHFIRSFKRAYDLTPTSYAREHRPPGQ